MCPHTPKTGNIRGMPTRPHPWLVLPAAVLAAAAALAWRGDLSAAAGWAALAAHEATLHRWVAAAPVGVAALYCALYAACVAASLPIGVVLTVSGGLLFGTAVGGGMALLSATAGAVALFLLARGVLAPLAARHAAPLLVRLEPRLREEGFWYLLALRLIPVVPFWLLNLASALVGLRLAPFVLATVIGAAPATFVLAGIGAGVGGVLGSGVQPDLSVLRSPPVLLPLAGLIVLSLLPVAWRPLSRRLGRRPAPHTPT
jgi:uncharacterized membrane protein YdjX (TVP38/TMEM64 family)